MAKWIYPHPDLVREGIVKQGQPLPVAQAVAAPQPAPESSEIPAHMIKPERPKRECKKPSVSVLVTRPENVCSAGRRSPRA